MNEKEFFNLSEQDSLVDAMYYDLKIKFHQFLIFASSEEKVLWEYTYNDDIFLDMDSFEKLKFVVKFERIINQLHKRSILKNFSTICNTEVGAAFDYFRSYKFIYGYYLGLLGCDDFINIKNEIDVILNKTLDLLSHKFFPELFYKDKNELEKDILEIYCDIYESSNLENGVDFAFITNYAQSLFENSIIEKKNIRDKIKCEIEKYIINRG